MAKVTANGQEYAQVGNRLYTRHAVERMQPSGNRYGGDSYIIQAGNKDYGDTESGGLTLAELIAIAERKYNEAAGTAPDLEGIEKMSYQEILDKLGYSSYWDYVYKSSIELGTNTAGEGLLEYIGKGLYRYVKGKILLKGTGETQLGKLTYNKDGTWTSSGGLTYGPDTKFW